MKLPRIFIFAWAAAGLCAQGTGTEKLEPVRSEITVTEKITMEAPASITLIGAPVLKQIPGVNLDDRLRMVPGFSLFRRSTSLAANPTTQGVSLRAIGSSGASRSLVLWDGMPINDPFGGWVYWTRVAPEAVAQVEVSRGASTSVFGDRAMGGSIAMFSRPIEGRHFYLGVEGGNAGQLSPSGGFTERWRGWGFSTQMRAFQTDGFYIVPARLSPTLRRGAADAKADVDFVAGDVRVDRIGADQRLSLKFDVLAEDRGNGTPLQRNSTSLGAVAANYSRSWTRDTLGLVGFHQRQQYHQSFSTIAADRATERLTSNQSVPAEALGGSAIWQHAQPGWTFTAGGDMNRVHGVSTDYLIPSGQRVGGGTVFQRGVFAQTNAKWKSLAVFLGGRQQNTGLQQGTHFFSPSAGFTYGRKRWRGRGSAYRSYRAPTLNELYREFRAGNTITQPNAGLRSETLFGAEVGADFIGEHSRFGVTLFRNSLDGLVTNVTLSSTPAQIVRQRRNVASALNRGVELEFRHNWRSLRWESSYLFADSRFSTRERVPQIAKHQGTAQLTWMWRNTLVTGGFRSVGLQFEDDRNTLTLPGFAVLQFVARQQLGRGVSASLAMENATNREFLSGLTPLPQIGAPRLWRAGLRWER